MARTCYARGEEFRRARPDIPHWIAAGRWCYQSIGMSASNPNSFTFQLDAAQQRALTEELRHGNYRLVEVPHARIAGKRPDCQITLYESGKCLVQGQGAADWVAFVLEPQILRGIVTGYDRELHPEAFTPHMGIDESGKGDFFGPMVIAAAYTDAALAESFRKLGVRDSKQISSDRKAMELAEAIRRELRGRFTIVKIGPRAYNRLYASMGSVNRLLAWGHARAIENLLEKAPDCPRAVADQFGPEQQIRQALMKAGKQIQLEQRPRAESDLAVAAASILARAEFLGALRKLEEEYGQPFPKGASPQVRAAAEALVRARGPQVLLEVAKCHFRTADQVLEAAGRRRADLGPDGQAGSKAARAEYGLADGAAGRRPGRGVR